MIESVFASVLGAPFLSGLPGIGRRRRHPAGAAPCSVGRRCLVAPVFRKAATAQIDVGLAAMVNIAAGLGTSAGVRVSARTARNRRCSGIDRLPPRPARRVECSARLMRESNRKDLSAVGPL